MSIRNFRALLMGTAAIALAGCGGGGVNSIPYVGGSTSTPTPPPTVAPAEVTIFPNPSPGEFASAGVSVSTTGRITSASDLPFRGLSGDPSDQVQLRYASDGTYEVKFQSSAWDTLINDPSIVDPTSANDLFTAKHETANSLAMRGGKYNYSALSSWTSSSAGRFGIEAFGSPTPSSAIPVTGSATFDGIAEGMSDVGVLDTLFMRYQYQPVSGTVKLTFDFANATLIGALMLNLNVAGSPSLGTFTFAGTNFSASDGSYSGHFVSGATGDNFFFGQLTGPQAQETIGAWAVPFHYSADGQDHQAFGAWIAKRP